MTMSGKFGLISLATIIIFGTAQAHEHYDRTESVNPQCSIEKSVFLSSGSASEQAVLTLIRDRIGPTDGLDASIAVSGCPVPAGNTQPTRLRPRE